MKINFANKTIIVTGATRGIGKSIATNLSKLSANLILTGTNEAEIEKLNLENNNKNKMYHCVDFTIKKSLSIFLDYLSSVEKIDGLVNNAGINRLNPINKIKYSDWDDMFEANLTTPFKLINTVSEKMIENKYGRIVNIGSIFSVISKTKRAAYTATKAGLHGLTVGVSNDLAKYNILVNTVSPGFMLTDLTYKNLSKDEIIDLAKQIPMNRLGDVDDISNAVLFLLSEKNAYITGQNLMVDGGFSNV